MPRSTVPVVLLMLAASLAGCEPRSNATTSDKPVHCTVVVDGPKKAEGTDRFAGRARFRCGSPGAQPLALTIRIEQRNGDTDTWRTVVTKNFTLRGKDTVAAELKYNSREATLSCRAGSFRTVVDWTRTSRGDKDTGNLVSGPMKDPCKNLFSG
jgi:hypothetical protein